MHIYTLVLPMCICPYTLMYAHVHTQVGISQINLILGVAGALSTVPITLVLPGRYLIALSQGPEGKAQRIKGHVALWAGVVLTIVCLYGTLAVGSG